MFHALEIGQHVLVAPAGGTQRLPAVVVTGSTAQKHKAIDRARTAEHLAARPAEAPAVEVGLGFRLIAPVDVGIGHQFAEAEGDVDPRIAVAPAGFEQAQTEPGVLGQTRRQHTASRARTRHHHIELKIERLSQEFYPFPDRMARLAPLREPGALSTRAARQTSLALPTFISGRAARARRGKPGSGASCALDSPRRAGRQRRPVPTGGYVPSGRSLRAPASAAPRFHRATQFAGWRAGCAPRPGPWARRLANR